MDVLIFAGASLGLVTVITIGVCRTIRARRAERADHSLARRHDD